MGPWLAGIRNPSPDGLNLRGPGPARDVESDHALARSHRRATYFAAGLFISEVWFGWADEEDLQPNYDGLSFDEVLLIAPLFGIAAIFVTWFIGRHHVTGPWGHHRPV